MSPTSLEPRPWHALEVFEVAELLAADPDKGLSPDAAAGRLTELGPNRIDPRRPPSRWRTFLSQFSNVLVWVLIFAALISGLILGDLVDAGVIMAIVLLNAVIGFSQEWRASDALARLEEMAAPEATVIRAGRRFSVDVADLVPGDLIVLSQGDQVPADARLVEAVNLLADEAPLTGESVPVRKGSSPCPVTAEVGDRSSIVFSGTAVASGRARAVVVSTGRATEVGKIADLLEAEEPPTPLELELDRIGRRIGVLAGIAAVIVVALGLLRSTPLQTLLLTAVALAVAAIPEGLPAVSTITLARGVRAMAERNAIVRRLPAVEALGAATVICTDKTGTLTENRMRAQRIVIDGVVRSLDEIEESPGEILESCGRIAALCSDPVAGEEGWEGDPTEVALIEAFDGRWVDASAVRVAFPRADEIPFDPERKRMTTVHRANGSYLIAAKGAPEVIVDLCTSEQTPEGTRPLTPSRKQAWLEAAADLASHGLRTLALAQREAEHPRDELEADLVLVGVVGMSDKARAAAPAAVQAALGAGIEVVMVTGDHEVTARAVADEIGLLHGRRVVSGRWLRSLDSAGLAGQVWEIGAYARVNPADKVTIIEAWKANGGIVAMTGDGVNDAPALRMADIGVAMGSGTDVARASADVVLADDDFASIVAAVEKGREIFSNLKKVVYFLIAANIAEIFVMLGGFLFFGGFGEPLLAVQLLWINLVTDGFPALALGVDPPPPRLMQRPPDVDRNILGRAHQRRLVWQGGVMAGGPLGIYAYGAYLKDLPWAEVRTMAFTSIVLVQLLFAYLVRAQTTSVWKSEPHRSPWLATGVSVSAVLQLLVILTPLGQRLFRTVLFPAEEWLVIMAASVIPIILIDLVKGLIRRLFPESQTAYD